MCCILYLYYIYKYLAELRDLGNCERSERNDQKMWIKTAEEDAFYKRMFQLADIDKNGKIHGKTAVDFFAKSGLPPAVLRQVR